MSVRCLPTQIPEETAVVLKLEKTKKKKFLKQLNKMLEPRKGKPILRWNADRCTWDLWPDRDAEYPTIHFDTLIEAMDLVYGRTKITICNA